MIFLLIPLSYAADNKIEDSDGDGLSDQYEERIGTEPYLSDTDGDGINDGIEVGENHNKPLNSDHDRYIDALDYDDDNDGLPTILESKADTDKDGLKDYLDTDSDNDLVSDGIEAGMLQKDNNHDLIDDAFDSEQAGAVDKNGDGINDNFKQPDHNNDGIPDYLDPKYAIKLIKKPLQKPLQKRIVAKKQSRKKAIELELSKKELAKKQLEELLKKRQNSANKAQKIVKTKDKKAQESFPKSKVAATTVKSQRAKRKEVSAKKNDPSKTVKPTQMVLNRYTDTDNDGLLDTQELILGTNPLKRDSDGDKVSDAIEIGMDINAPQDSDHDGIIDALDPDDDNDGVYSKNEDINNDSSPINDDTDNDGVPNYLDANDDGDDKLTIVEGSTKDTDNDGILDYLDKNDGVKAPHKLTKNKQSIPKTPEVVVLFDGSLDSLDAQSEDIDENNALDKNDENIAKTVVEETIEDVALDSNQTKQGNNSKPKKEKGFISWITSLLPD